MNKKTKTFVYQLLCFSALFLVFRIALGYFTNISGIWLPFLSAVFATILAPQFQFVNTPEGGKIFMKWIFTKGVKEVK